MAADDPGENDPLGKWDYANPARELRSLSRLTDGEMAAIESFALNNYERINGALRGQREITPDIRRDINAIRSGLRKYPLDHDVRVTREVGGAVYGITAANAGSAVEALIGQVFDEYGFMSASMAPTPAHSARHHDPLTLDLLVPAGTPALAVQQLSEYPLEREMLLIDARRYQIIGARYDRAQRRWRLFGLVDQEA
ncbi:ADP-ribosyltransferase [Mycolicibacterium wolinskyi]|uniref:ADP-ribosyltransferase n=1 Tax=Mycolicibacterium wolinskyi TaxID=59750 RepID=UPI0039178E7A